MTLRPALSHGLPFSECRRTVMEPGSPWSPENLVASLCVKTYRARVKPKVNRRGSMPRVPKRCFELFTKRESCVVTRSLTAIRHRGGTSSGQGDDVPSRGLATLQPRCLRWTRSPADQQKTRRSGFWMLGRRCQD